MNKNGFTLIELLAVILILGIIALIAIPTVNGVIEESRQGAKENSGSNLISKTSEFCISSKLNKEEPNSNVLSYESDEYPTVESLIGIKGDVPNYSNFLQYELTDGCEVKVIYETDGYKCSNQLDSDGNVTYSISLDNTTADKVTCEKTDTSVFVNQTKMLSTDGTKHVLKTYYDSEIDDVSNTDFRSDTYRNTIYEIELTNHTNVPDSVTDDKKWDVSEEQDGSIIAWLVPISDGSSYNKLYIGSTGDIYANPDSSGIFCYMPNLTKISFGNFKTDDVIYMSWMFDGDSSLTSLDVSNFNMTNVIDTNYMFYNCSGLKSIDISNFKNAKLEYTYVMFASDTDNPMTLEEIRGIEDLDTSNVINMYGMFYNNRGIKSLDLSKWDTSNVINMSWMFACDINLINLDLSGWDTSNVLSMSSMFFGLFDDNGHISSYMNLGKIKGLENFDISNVLDMSYMFAGNKALESLDLSKWNTSSVTNMSYMFYDIINLNNLVISNFNTSNVTNMYAMFANSYNLTSLDLSGWNTSNVTNMAWMFAGYSWDYKSKLSEIKGIENFKTGNVINISWMFFNNDSLRSLDLSKWDTSKVTNMTSLFGNCTALESVNISTWNMSSVLQLHNIFVNSYVLSDLELPKNFITNKITNLNCIFASAESLRSLDISGWDTSNVTNYNYAFDLMISLTSFDASLLNVNKATNLNGIFYGDSNITTLDLSSWNTSNVTDMYRSFAKMSNLSTIYVSDNWNVINVTNSKEMFKDDTKLVGAVSYDSSKIDKTMANYETGYLTLKS